MGQGLLDGRWEIRNFRGRLRWASLKRIFQFCKGALYSSADVALPEESDHVWLGEAGRVLWNVLRNGRIFG